MSHLLPPGLFEKGLDKYNEPYPRWRDRADHGPQHALRQLVNSHLIIEILQDRDPAFFKEYPPELINFACMMCSIGRIDESDFSPERKRKKNILQWKILEGMFQSQKLTPEILEKYKKALCLYCDPNSQKHNDSDVKKIAFIIELSHRIDHERIPSCRARESINTLLSYEKRMLGLFTEKGGEDLLRTELTKLADSRRQKLSAECKKSTEHYKKSKMTIEEAELFLIAQSPENFLSQGPINKTLPDRHLEKIVNMLLTDPYNIIYSTGGGGKIYYKIVNGDKYCLTDILETGASFSNVKLSEKALTNLKGQIKVKKKELPGVIGTKNSNLTPEWVQAIRLYTGTYYLWINSLLRSKVSEDKSEEHIKKALFFNQAINLGIAELREFEPPPKVKTLWRGENEDLSRSTLWVSKATLSTSGLRNVAQLGEFGYGRYMYEFSSDGFIYIKPFSVKSHEEEYIFQSGNRFMLSGDGKRYKAVNSPSFVDNDNLVKYENDHYFNLNKSKYRDLHNVCAQLGIEFSSGVLNSISNYFVSKIRSNSKFSLNANESKLFEYCDHSLLYVLLGSDSDDLKALKAFLTNLEFGNLNIHLDNIKITSSFKVKKNKLFDLKKDIGFFIKIIKDSIENGQFKNIDKLFYIGNEEEDKPFFYKYLLERTVESFSSESLEDCQERDRLELIDRLLLGVEDKEVDSLKYAVCVQVLNKGYIKSLPKYLTGVESLHQNSLFEEVLKLRKLTPELIQGFKSCDFDFKQKVEGLWNKAIYENNYDVIDYLLDVKKMSGDELKFHVDIEYFRGLIDKDDFKLANKILDMRCVEGSEVKPVLTEVFRNTLSCEGIGQTKGRMTFLYSAGFDTKQECMRIFREALADPDTNILSKIRENWCKIDRDQCPTISFSECFSEALKGDNSLKNLKTLQEQGFIFPKILLRKVIAFGDLDLFLLSAKMLWDRRIYFGLKFSSGSKIMSTCYDYLVEKLQRLHAKHEDLQENLEPAVKTELFKEIKMFNFLNTAVKKGNIKSISFLIKIGFDINYIRDDEKWETGMSNGGGYSALMWAAKKGCPDIADVLIRAGANLELKDRKGNTALMWAIKKDNFAIVAQLILVGGDVNTSVNGSKTALEIALKWAKSNNNKDMINKLLAAGAAYKYFNSKSPKQQKHSKVKSKFKEIINCQSVDSIKQAIKSKPWYRWSISRASKEALTFLKNEKALAFPNEVSVG